MRIRFVLVVGLVLLISTPSLAGQRMVVVENFTNSGCPYCADVKPFMDKILTEEYEGLIVPIAYHGWWPASTDPFYEFNT